MVDVQPTNRKLHQRAVGIVQQASGLAPGAAEALLQEAGGEVKTAIIVGRTSIAPEQAREQLAAHDQFLRRALDALDAKK